MEAMVITNKMIRLLAETGLMMCFPGSQLTVTELFPSWSQLVRRRQEQSNSVFPLPLWAWTRLPTTTPRGIVNRGAALQDGICGGQG